MTHLLLIIGFFYILKWAWFDNEKTISEKIKRKRPELNEAELEQAVKKEFEFRIASASFLFFLFLLLAIFGP